MKTHLMYRDQDFDAKQQLPWNGQALTQDLEFETLFSAMASGDKFLLEVARTAVLSSIQDRATIIYRQDVLRDCLKNPAIVRDMYNLAVESIEKEKKSYFRIFNKSPGGILHSATEVMHLLVGLLKRLRAVAEEHAHRFESEGFLTFFAMLREELDDDYFERIEDHLRELKFRNGVSVSARLGEGGKGTHHVLREPLQNKVNLERRFFLWVKGFFRKRTDPYTFCLHPRDESGARAMGELRERGINLVANAFAQSLDHILSFFIMMRTELAFYVGCLNLHGRLAQMGAPASFPRPFPQGERKHSFRELYDICLALKIERRVVGNDADADHRDLVIVTGANQGGKSTFLRSIGLAQLMMQCGMFVPAESFSSNVCDGIFTHYKREEDVTMESGKLDEELSRMSDIVGHIRTNSLVLFNESFAATNEREGSEIGRQITRALLDKRVKIFFVTHQYTLAHGFFAEGMQNAAFLRAERQADGRRTFRVIEGAPLQTSYGEDLYHRIFGTESFDREQDRPLIHDDAPS